MLPNVQLVQLSSIDLDDNTFRISTSTDCNALRASLEYVGLLQPPILSLHKKSHRIISGFSRISTALDLGWTEITARILPKTISQQDCIRMAISDNRCHRQLNLVELGRCFSLLAAEFKDPDLLAAEADSLNLGINQEMAVKLESVIRMNAKLQQGLIEQSIALPVALKIKEMKNPQDADMLSELLLELKLSLNRQRELVDWIEAISHKDKISITEFLLEPQFRKLCEDPNLDARQTSANIRQYIKQRRFPTIVETEERYNRYLKRTKIPKGIQLIPPSHFEGDTYCIKADFKTIEELILINQRIDDLVHSEALVEMLKL